MVVPPAHAQTLPPGEGHDLVAKACTQCHDASVVASQKMTASQWADTVKQMVSNGASVTAGDFDRIVAYLAKNFGTAEATALVPSSKNEVPYYAPLTWQMIEGKPIETRWPEKQDDAPDFPGQTRAPYHASVPYKTTIITDKLIRPWALQFLPDGKMLVTERMGQMVIVDSTGAISNPLRNVPEAVWEGGQGGLLDVALDPAFRQNHRIFFCYDEAAGPQSKVGKDGTQSRIVVGRAILDEAGGALEDVRVIFRSRPAISANLYPTKQGSRIAIDRDGNLLISIGDRDSTKLQPPAWNVAQELSTHLGKIIKITPNGTPASDNPFIGQPDALPEIWAIGVRSQGRPRVR